jgi:hypothetical protein
MVFQQPWGLMFMIHEILVNKRKLKKKIQCPFIKSLSFLYGSGLF